MITIVDYGMSNLRSVAKAFEAIGCAARVSSEPGDLEKAERIVLPGDGAFGVGMANLRRLGLVEALTREVIDKGKPFLGICLGMQLLARLGWEDGQWPGLGWIGGEVRPLDGAAHGLKVPHIGWNDVSNDAGSLLLAGLGARPAFYFVHSYRVLCDDAKLVKSVCDYGGAVAAVIERDNVFATQFHPEKSQRDGLQLLRNFVGTPA